MTYSAAVDYLLSLLGGMRSSNFGLERMERLRGELGRPDRDFQSVHIAGTNGKGSTAAMIESGLRAGGRSTGLYTSPHLSRFNERIRINGAEIADAEFAAAADEVRAANERLLTLHGRAGHPTFFETMTATAFCAFRRAGCEWGIIEVGLGGRLDATNVVEPRLSVITAIDLDHEAFLGKSAAFIAGEKAGILKPGVGAVLAPQPPAAAAVVRERAAELGAPLTRIGRDWRAENLRHERGFYSFDAWSERLGRGGSIPIEVPLAGEHQVHNALTAAAALDRLGIQPDDIRRGIGQTRWPGRLEFIQGDTGGPGVLLDAAHNPAGARALAAFLEEHTAGRPIRLIYGAVRDKAVDEVAGLLFPLAASVVLTRSRVPRSLRPETLHEMVDHLHGELSTAPDVESAIEQARSAAGADDLLVVCGSIFLVGEAREALMRRSPLKLEA